MSQLSGTWDGTTVGDATTAPYNTAEWARIQREILGGMKANSGIVRGTGISPDEGLTVRQTTPVSASVEVTAGSALVYGYWYASSATERLTPAANASGNPRIDTVVLRVDMVAQTVRLAILQGTPAGTPVAPALTQTPGVTWEIPVADISLISGFTLIYDINIGSRREWLNAPYGVFLDDVKNSSVGDVNDGNVIILDTANPRAAIWTITKGDPLVLGVWRGKTPSGGYGRVQTKGIGLVKVDAAVPAIGTVLVPSTTQHYATPQSTAATASKRNAIGVALQTTTGIGYCLAYIDVGTFRPGAIVSALSNAGVFSTNSLVLVDVDASAVITITPHSDRVKVTFQFEAYNAAHIGSFNVYSVGLAALATPLIINSVTAGHGSLTVVAIFTGLATGVAQTFKLQWKTSDAGDPTLINDKVFMYAEEL